MVTLILAPICPNCHYIFKRFSVTTDTTFASESIINKSHIRHFSHLYCPQCREVIIGITGEEFPSKDGCYEFDLESIEGNIQ